ncbi:MAG: hypothetical protein AAFY88_07705 [Acidobacteriota bacterium]
MTQIDRIDHIPRRVESQTEAGRRETDQVFDHGSQGKIAEVGSENRVDILAKTSAELEKELTDLEQSRRLKRETAGSDEVRGFSARAFRVGRIFDVSFSFVMGVQAHLLPRGRPTAHVR